MADIVYGVSGEGSGHSSRSRVIISHLIRMGHRVKVVSYDRGYRNLQDDFDVFETEGLHISSQDNKVSLTKTLVDNLKRLPEGRKKLRDLRKRLFKPAAPDCVFTDFEPMTSFLANHYDIPLVTIDNQHRMRYMDYPYPPRLKKERLVTESVIRAMVPKPDLSLVTSFYFGKVKNERTFVFPPILREEILGLRPERKEHILVYLTSGFNSFLELLPRYAREHFIVYGYNKEEHSGNITFRQPSRQGFLEDLASCKAVMATAGFTLMTESLYLRKPYLALPMRGQYEQELNGYLLAKLRYGVNARHIKPEIISGFLYHLPDFSKQLTGYRAEDNGAIKARIDQLLQEDCARLKQYHRRRTPAK